MAQLSAVLVRQLRRCCLHLLILAGLPGAAAAAAVAAPAPAPNLTPSKEALTAGGRPALAPMAPALPPRRLGAPLRLHWTQIRANAQVVQNATGNAYSLQAGWTPKLRLRDLPIGLQLLAEIGGLRTIRKEVFVMPSVQALVTWQVVEHLELAIGAGVQFWCLPRHVVRPLATLEAHYLPHWRLARVIRSGFVAASLGASSGAGLQVRAGLSFDFQRDLAAPPPTVALAPRQAAAHPPVATVASHLRLPPPLHLHRPERVACPTCPACPAPSAPALLPPEDVILASHLTFPFNQAVLTEVQVDWLRGLAAALAAEPEVWQSLDVVGHADSIGTSAHTQLVSNHRTEAVIGVLREAGVAAERLSGSAVGETMPIVGLPTDVAAQRRVVLRLRGYRGSARLNAFVHVDDATFKEHSR